MKLTVKAIRVNANISQQEAADYLGISLTAYCRKENGQSKFWADEIERLAALFGVSIDIFFEPVCLKKTRKQNPA